MIDSHAHLTYPDYGEEGPEALISRAAAAGVERIICVAYDIPSCADVLELAKREDRVSAVIGIHPHEAYRATGEDLQRIRQMAMSDQGIGVAK